MKTFFLLALCLAALLALPLVNATVLYAYGCEDNNITAANFSTVSSVHCSADTRINGSYTIHLPQGMTSNAYLWNFTAPANYNFSFFAITNETAANSNSGGICIEWGATNSCYGSGGGAMFGWNGGAANKTNWLNLNTGVATNTSLGTTPAFIRYEVTGASVGIYINNVKVGPNIANTPVRLDWKNSDGTIDAYFDSLCFWTGTDAGCYPSGAPPINYSVPNASLAILPNGSFYDRYVNITYTAANATTSGASIAYYNLSLLNSDLSFNSTIIVNNGVNLNYLWDAHIPGIRNGTRYYIEVMAVDNYGYNATNRSAFFYLNYNGHFNLTLRNRWSNNTVYPFNGYAESTALGINNTYSNLSSLIYANIVTPGNYSLYFFATNYSVGPENNATVEITTNSKNYTHYLYSNNSIVVNIYSQTNGSLILSNISTEFIGTVYRQNYTTTGRTYQDNIPDGIYDIQLSGTGFLTNIYTTTVTDSSTQTINAYLLLNSTTYGTVVFTIYDIETGAVISGASIGAYKFVNGTRVLVESHYTDITGRAQFNYIPSSNYQFIVSNTGYTAETFLLSPVIFSSYDIKLRRISSYPSDMIFSGVSVYYTPKSFNKNTTTPFSIYFYAANGTLSSYNYTLSYPGGSGTGTGTNSQGGSFSHNMVLAQSITTYAYANLTYCYTKVDTAPNCFTVQTQIGGYSGRGTLAGIATDNYGMGVFESTFLVTIIAVIMGGIGALALGPIVGGLVGLLVFVLFASAGFITWWIVVPSLVVGLFLILRGGGV